MRFEKLNADPARARAAVSTHASAPPGGSRLRPFLWAPLHDEEISVPGNCK